MFVNMRTRKFILKKNSLEETEAERLSVEAETEKLKLEEKQLRDVKEKFVIFF